MTLSEKYKHLDLFKPYFILWLNLQKNPECVVELYNQLINNSDIDKKYEVI
jgi:hypothetical protein